MDYRYRAIAADGRLVSGNEEAASPGELDGRLQRRGLELLAAVPAKRWQRQRTAALPRRELIDFCFHLEQLSRAGVPLLDALRDLQASSEQPRSRAILATLVDAIAGGQPLSQALQAAPASFPALFTNLIRAGETGGCLPEILHRLGHALRHEDELIADRRRALIYPALVAGTLAAALGFLMIFLVPQLKQFVAASGQTLPLHARLLFALADGIAANWPRLLGVAAALPLIAGLAIRHDSRCRDFVEAGKLRLPVYGTLLKKADLARFAATLALLYGAGIPVLEAIRESSGSLGNGRLRLAIAEVGRRIGEGSNLAAAFAASGLFPPLLVRMLHVGESTGRLDEALAHVAHFYQRDVQEAVARTRTLTEPLLTLIMGLLLGWIVLAALGPIYDIIGRLAP